MLCFVSISMRGPPCVVGSSKIVHETPCIETGCNLDSRAQKSKETPCRACSTSARPLPPDTLLVGGQHRISHVLPSSPPSTSPEYLLRGQNSLPKGSPQAASLGAMLLGPGQPAERLCSYLLAQEAHRAAASGDAADAKAEGVGGGGDPVAPWAAVRLHIMDTIGVMCGVSDEAVQVVVSTGAVRCVLGVLR